MPFINRVNISVSDSDSGKDSIDVVVKVLDSSLKPRIFPAVKLGWCDRRKCVGITFDFLYRNDSKERQNYVLGSYTAYNLFGSYINAQILGERDFRNERINFNVRRDFFSPA